MKKDVVVQVTGSETAPVIYTDGCVAWKPAPGIIELEMGVHMVVPVRVDGQDTVRDKWVCCAHLRMTPAVAERFVAVLDDALDVLRKPASAPNGKERTVVPDKLPPDKVTQ